MLSTHSVITYCLCFTFGLQFHAAVRGDIDLSEIFGSNIDKDGAWTKLFELEDCHKPQLWPDTIIMVNESLTAGAKFMDNPNVTNRYECEFECCYKQEQGCDIAVYTAEQKHCYLFSCGQPSKCKFEQHKGYTVSSLAEEITDKKVETVTTPRPSTTTTSQAPPKQLHLLDGCRPDIDTCVTPNTECSATGFCMCKDQFHPKNGVCRQDCLHGLQFECTNGDAKYSSPDCVAVYDVCDGTPQCPDGSDERDCDKDTFNWSKLGDIPSLKASLEEYIKKHASTTALPTSTVKSKPAVEDIKALLSGTEKPAAKPESPLDSLSSNTSSKVTAKSGAHTTIPTLSEQSGNGTDSTGEDKSVVEEKVDLMVDTSSRSAVIALSLTLTLTVVLFIYLACKYKNMRRRVGRPGKPVNGTEVDYLIDGMYL